jgi:hypothetical protein
METMAEIIKPDALNERFTLYLNAAGMPVQRTLREMTAGEVSLAFDWSRTEADRLDRAAEPARAIAIALEEGRREVLSDMTRADMNAATASLDRRKEAVARHVRLMRLTQAAMPQWQDHNDNGLRNALRRWWPGGRHAA